MCAWRLQDYVQVHGVPDLIHRQSDQCCITGVKDTVRARHPKLQRYAMSSSMQPSSHQWPDALVGAFVDPVPQLQLVEVKPQRIVRKTGLPAWRDILAVLGEWDA